MLVERRRQRLQLRLSDTHFDSLSSRALSYELDDLRQWAQRFMTLGYTVTIWHDRTERERVYEFNRKPNEPVDNSQRVELSTTRGAPRTPAIKVQGTGSFKPPEDPNKKQ